MLELRRGRGGQNDPAEVHPALAWDICPRRLARQGTPVTAKRFHQAASGSQFPKLQIPTQIFQAKYNQPKIPC